MRFRFYCLIRNGLSGIILFVIWTTNTTAQSESHSLKLANQLFKEKQFSKATQQYKLSGSKLDKNNSSLYQAGISAYESNQLSFSIECFQKLKRNGSEDHESTNWYLALAYQHQNEFEEAIKAYKTCYKNLSKNDLRRAYIKNELLRCTEGLKIKRKTPLAIVESIGTGINTPQDETAPLPVQGHSKLIYYAAIRDNNKGGIRNDEGLLDLSNGRIRYDIFQMNLLNGRWTGSPIPNTFANSPKDDFPESISDDGNVLIYSSSWTDEVVALLTDSLNSTRVQLETSAFKSPAFAEIGDRTLSVFQDSILIFSSARAGGYGGYDLYMSILRNDEWTQPVNLGPKINTPFNEVSPFIANDGLSLYYSTNQLKSIGGYDIFKTAYKPEAQLWTTPVNLGLPVNSAGDDLGFKLTADGLAGIFSSNRKTDNQGGFDIYWAYFKDELTEQTVAAQGSPLGLIYDLGNSGNTNEFNISDDISKENIKLRDFKTYSIDPVYYTDSDFMEDPKTKKVLDQIVKILVAQTELQIQLIGHSYEDTPDPINLYFSLKKAEEIEKYLVQQNIAKNRISCYGLGASIPVAKVKINGNKSSMSDKLNKRIEVYFNTTDQSNVRINYNTPNLAESIKDDRPGPFGVIRRGLSYSLYLGESTGLLAHTGINFHNGVSYVQKFAGQDKYRYFFGVYKNFKEAEINLVKLKDQNFPITEIRAFIDGVEIDRADIINHVLKHGDLILLLNFLNETDKIKK